MLQRPFYALTRYLSSPVPYKTVSTTKETSNVFRTHCNLGEEKGDKKEGRKNRRIL